MQQPGNYIAPFNGIVDPKDRMTRENEESFGSGWSTVTLKKGMVLYRFTSGRNAFAFSDCWIDEPTYTTMIRELQNATETTMQLTDPQKRERIRHYIGVLGHWNKIARRVKITLKEDVVAHVGEIGPQFVHVALPEDDAPVSFRDMKGPRGSTPMGKIEKRIEVRRGGHTQYLIPRFKDRSLDQEENKFAAVNVNTGLFRKGR